MRPMRPLSSLDEKVDFKTPCSVPGTYGPFITVRLTVFTPPFMFAHQPHEVQTPKDRVLRL